jgi:hypothetical protein
MKLKDCVMLISMSMTEVAVNMKKFWVFGCWGGGGDLNVVLTSSSLMVTLHTTRINIQQFCIVFTLCLCVVCDLRTNKQKRLPCMTLTKSFLITGGDI